ncbi:MAG TPA: hypothetical protein V6D16_02585 [Candidatus Obscuribacterales bacterium]
MYAPHKKVVPKKKSLEEKRHEQSNRQEQSQVSSSSLTPLQRPNFPGLSQELNTGLTQEAELNQAQEVASEIDTKLGLNDLRRDTSASEVNTEISPRISDLQMKSMGLNQTQELIPEDELVGLSQRPRGQAVIQGRSEVLEPLGIELKEDVEGDPRDSKRGFESMKGETQRDAKQDNAVQHQAELGYRRQRNLDSTTAPSLLTPFEMNEEDWEARPEYFDQGEGSLEQYKRDASLWFNTLFPNEDSPEYQSLTKDQKSKDRLMREQLKRHFLAMAVLEVELGAREEADNQNPENFEPIERRLPGVPLAAIASHGGRLAFDSQDKKSGEEFKKWWLGKSLKKEIVGSGFMTHGAKFDEKRGRWIETKGNSQALQGLGGAKDKGEIARNRRMHFAMGGIGNRLKTPEGNESIVGYAGRHKEQLNKKGGKENVPGVCSRQQGEMTFGAYTDKKSQAQRLWVGFENSEPITRSVTGAFHGPGGKKNPRSITGQGKWSTLGFTDKIGQMQSGEVTSEKVQRMEDLYKTLKSNIYVEKAFYKRILISTTQEEREAAIDEVLGRSRPERLSEVAELTESEKEAGNTLEVPSVEQLISEYAGIPYPEEEQILIEEQPKAEESSEPHTWPWLNEQLSEPIRNENSLSSKLDGEKGQEPEESTTFLSSNIPSISVAPEDAKALIARDYFDQPVVWDEDSMPMQVKERLKETYEAPQKRSGYHKRGPKNR